MLMFESWSAYFSKGYPEFGYHLNRTGRPMIYSCSWPVYQIYAGMQVWYFLRVKIETNLLICIVYSGYIFLCSPISHPSLNIAIFGVIMMTFKIPGKALKQSLTISETTKMLSFLMLGQGIGMTLTW